MKNGCFYFKIWHLTALLKLYIEHIYIMLFIIIIGTDFFENHWYEVFRIYEDGNSESLLSVLFPRQTL